MRIIRLAMIFLALAPTALLVHGISAQQSIPTPTLVRLEAGLCPRCTLTLERAAVIGAAGDPELIPDYAIPAVARAGQFLIGDVMGRQPILRYDASGRYVGTLGRIGGGPGEFHGAQAIAAARGDSITVYSYPLLSTISMGSGLGRSVKHATGIQGFRLFTLPDGSNLIQNSRQPNPAFVVVAPGGETLRMFGPMAGKADLGHGDMVPDHDAQQFVLARAPSGGFWAASQYYHHLLEHWTNDGKSVLRIDRKPTWFTPYEYSKLGEYRRLGGGLVPQVSMTLGVWVDGAGHLFVVGRGPDAHWRQDPAAVMPPPGESVPPPTVKQLTGGIDRYFDGVVEVYDEKTGALLGSWRADVFPGVFTEAGLLADSRQDADGVKSYVFRRPVFSSH